MIDLRSDTVTRPSEEMRDAARDAEVGDDVYGEDPTVNELEARAADLVGMEDAIYVPTGTMGNQIAARVHTERGQEVIVERESHIYKWELAGLSQLAGLQPRTLDGGDRGVFTPEQVHEGYVEENDHRPGTGLVAVENTHNSKGGVAITAEEIDAVAEAAGEYGVPVHVDGARIFNAATALDTPADRLLENVDSVMFCLSKGLGAPVGSMLAGSEEFIGKAHRVRKLFGGGMRQVGVVAGPGLRSLENVERLGKDHENARRLAEGLSGTALSVQEPETNIVLLDTEPAGMTAAEFLAAVEDEGVLGSEFDDYVVRFCTHWDVDGSDVDEAVERVKAALD